MADLCQLDDVKIWLGISLADTSSDALLSRLISAVSADFLNEIGRPELAPAADYTETIFRRPELLESGGFDYSRLARQEIFLRRYPVNSIASVTVNDNAITEVIDPTLDSGWWFDPTRQPEDRQKILLIGHWYPIFNIPFAWMPNIVVVYNGGYADVPAAIVQAVIEWVAFRRGQGQLQQLDQSDGAQKIGDYEELSAASTLALRVLAASLPDNVQRVIDQYRRVVI
jgi:hypothetical protein